MPDLTLQERRELFLSADNPPAGEDLPTVTVRGSFDWPFWALLTGVLWLLYKELDRGD